MKLTYTHTRIACYANFFSTAVCISLMGLLLTSLQREFGLDMGQLAILISALTFMQLAIVPIMTAVTSKVGFRPMMILIQVFFFAGICGLGIFPSILPNPFTGLVLAVILYAIGMGISESINSAVIESLPSKNKDMEMGRLHAVFPAAQLAVIILTTVYFGFVNTEAWRVLPIAYSIVPLLNFFLCLKIPYAPPVPEGQQPKMKSIITNKVFIFFLLFIFFEGFVELCMSQWASMFAEAGLGVSKSMGDLLGPGLSTLGVLISRSFFGFKGDKIPVEKIMLVCSVICFIAHMMVAFISNPIVCLLGVGLNGLGIGIMFPGLFAVAARAFPNAGVKLFGTLSFSTYIGISLSGWMVGKITTFAETTQIPVLSSIIPATDAVEMGMRTSFFIVGIIALIMLLFLWLAFRGMKQQKA